MKKLVFVFSMLILLAASCNSSLQTSSNAPATYSTIPPQPIKNYVDEQYRFTITLPEGFYMNKGVEDGIYAYTKTFSTQPGQSPKMEPTDISLIIQISHAKGQLGMYTSLADVTKDFQARIKADKNVKIYQNKTLTVDSLPALEQFEDYSKAKEAEFSCGLETFFQQGNEVHNISAFSNSCSALLAFKAKYEATVNSFKFTK